MKNFCCQLGGFSLEFYKCPCNTPPAPEQITADEGTFHGRYHLFACLCPSLSHLWVGMFPERTPLLGCKSLSRFSAHIHKETATYPHATMLLEWLTTPPKKTRKYVSEASRLKLANFFWREKSRIYHWPTLHTAFITMNFLPEGPSGNGTWLVASIYA